MVPKKTSTGRLQTDLGQTMLGRLIYRSTAVGEKKTRLVGSTSQRVGSQSVDRRAGLTGLILRGSVGSRSDNPRSPDQKQAAETEDMADAHRDMAGRLPEFASGLARVHH
jgi:hypothetical protein